MLAFLKSHTKKKWKSSSSASKNLLKLIRMCCFPFSLPSFALSSQMISYEMCHSLAELMDLHILSLPSYKHFFYSHASLKMRTTIIQIWSWNDTCVCEQRWMPYALLSHFKRNFERNIFISFVTIGHCYSQSYYQGMKSFDHWTCSR